MIKYDKSPPTTVKQAVEWLISELPLEKKARIENAREWNLMGLYFSLSVEIENKLCLHENKALVESCGAVAGGDSIFAAEASYIIITELWKRLQKSR